MLDDGAERSARSLKDNLQGKERHTTSIIIMRSIGSYAKVRHWVSHFIRNNPLQVRRALRSGKVYLDLGCGPNIHDHVVNLDYLWRPGVDICWDVARGLPLPDCSMKGVFSEHCLEHFSLPAGLALLREAYRVLEPQGVIRIIVPDAGLYLDNYSARKSGSGVSFPFEAGEHFDGAFVPLLSVNRIFYQDRDSLAGHRTMYDEDLLGLVLRRAGFVDVQRRVFKQGKVPELLLDTPSRECESLYMEARRPGESR
jgi:predicted SAM-dependent methyltransferase